MVLKAFLITVHYVALSVTLIYHIILIHISMMIVK